jgi:hypothetical protein
MSPISHRFKQETTQAFLDLGRPRTRTPDADEAYGVRACSGSGPARQRAVRESFPRCDSVVVRATPVEGAKLDPRKPARFTRESVTPAATAG